MGERVRLGGIPALFQTCHSSVKSSGGGGQRSVMTRGNREVYHQWEVAFLYACVCVDVCVTVLQG